MSRIVVLALVVIISLATAFVVPLPKLKKPEEVHQKWKGTIQPFNHAQTDTRTPPLPLLDATVKMASAATASYQPSPVELQPMEVSVYSPYLVPPRTQVSAIVLNQAVPARFCPAPSRACRSMKTKR